MNFENSKRYKSTEVDRKAWLYVPLGTFGPLAVTLKYKKMRRFATKDTTF